jgi:condensin complex subunit 3
MLGKVYISAPTAPSRAGSRVPESSEDAFRSSARSTREEIDPANVALAETVKELLNQAIEDGVGPDATSRNALVKVKNTILKILAAAAAQASSKEAGRSTRASTVDTEYTSVESRQHSVEPSGIASQAGAPDVAVDETIMEVDEEDENDDSRGTVFKNEGHSQDFE